jgi:hypothetical protein
LGGGSLPQRKVFVGPCRKPSQGASPEEIRRYVFEKYVKKRYVVDRTEEDPLSAYKKMLKDKK